MQRGGGDGPSPACALSVGVSALAVGAFHEGCLLGPASEDQRCVSGVEKEEAEVFGSGCMESDPIGDLVVGLEGKKPKDF